MAIYDKNGIPLNACYDKNGSPLNAAYDKSGNQIWQRQTGPVHLKVMSYNIQKGLYGNRVLRIAEGIFDEEQPDIVGFQELGTSGWPSLLSGGGLYSTWLANNYDLAYSQIGNQAYNKTGIASKYPITDFQCIKFSIQDSLPEWREYTKCHITVDEKQVLWYNTHLGLGPTYRATMRDELLADIETAMETEDYIILTGDTNVQVTTTETTDSEFYTEQIQPWIDAGLTLANWQNFGFIPTFTDSTGSGTWKCLDNIMVVSPKITIADAWTNTVKVDDNQESYQVDHIPFVVDLVLN